jgi:DNA-directed RNA polymerase sigma subunit (sigma70/sigma32)
MNDHAKEAGFRTVQDLVRALAPCFGTGFFTKREERVLGLRIAHDCTLWETAKIVSRMEGFGDKPITRERVRQIENKALLKWKARHTVHLCPHCGKESVSANAGQQPRA